MNYDDIDSPQKLLAFMDNIKYGWISKKDNHIKNGDENFYDEYFLQSPSQLLDTKHGLCWDQVELERDWFLKNKYQIKTFFMWFEVDYENKYPTHTFLVYKKENKYYWFEHSFYDYKGIHEYNSYELLIEDVKQKQLDYSIKNNVVEKMGYSLIKIYEYGIPKNGSNVNEYIKFVTGSS